MKIRQPEGSGVAIFAWLLECVQLLMITKAYGQINRTASTYIILFSGMYYVMSYMQYICDEFQISIAQKKTVLDFFTVSLTPVATAHHRHPAISNGFVMNFKSQLAVIER